MGVWEAQLILPLKAVLIKLKCEVWLRFSLSEQRDIEGHHIQMITVGKMTCLSLREGKGESTMRLVRL